MKNYIPREKVDEKAIGNLKSRTFETVRADVPELLEWMQDMNWGNGHGIGEYLAPYTNEIKTELLYTLNTDDDIWKANIIRSLIADSPTKLDEELATIIKRIAENPTKFEIEEGTDEAARDLIASNLWLKK